MFTIAFSTILNFLETVTVEPVLFLHMLAIFSQYSVFQDLVYSRVCFQKYDVSICHDLQPSTNPNSSQTILDDVQATSSGWIFLSTVSSIVPSILMAVYLGSWSDRFGRKWPVAIPPFGAAIGSLVYIVIAAYPEVHVGYICLASVFSGLTGGFTSCIMSCASYIAATTTEVQRTVRISRLEAMTFVGGTVGPFISALFLSVASTGYAFLFMFTCYVLAIFYVVLFVKNIPSAYEFENPAKPRGAVSNDNNVNREGNESNESLTFSGYGSTLTGESSPLLPNYRSAVQETKNKAGNLTNGHNGGPISAEHSFRRYFGSNHFLTAIHTTFKSRPNGGRRLILTILVIGFFTMTVTAGEADVGFLFARDAPLSWTPEFYSYFIGFKFAIGSLVLIVGMPIFRKLELTDATVCLIATISRMAGLICFGRSTSTTVAFLAPIVGLFSFMSIPTIRAMLSKLVEPNEQGKMFSFVAIMEDVCTLSASALFNGLYPVLRPISHGLIFQVAAMSLLLPLVLLWAIRSRMSS